MMSDSHDRYIFGIEKPFPWLSIGAAVIGGIALAAGVLWLGAEIVDGHEDIVF